jgi:hypothetical protein
MPITKYMNYISQCFNLSALRMGGTFEFEDMEFKILKAKHELAELKRQGRF